MFHYIQQNAKDAKWDPCSNETVLLKFLKLKHITKYSSFGYGLHSHRSAVLILPTVFKSMVICPRLRPKAIVSEHRVLPVCCLSQCSSFKKFLRQDYYILLLKKSASSGSLEPSTFFTFFAKIDNFKILISRSQSWYPNKKRGGELMFWIATVERDTNNMKKCLSGRLGGAHL